MGRKKLKCWIIREWDCHVEAEEIPLEVCRLCAETKLKHIMVRRKVKANGKLPK